VGTLCPAFPSAMPSLYSYFRITTIQDENGGGFWEEEEETGAFLGRGAGGGKARKKMGDAEGGALTAFVSCCCVIGRQLYTTRITPVLAVSLTGYGVYNKNHYQPTRS
jgi:hypothetical protein